MEQTEKEFSVSTILSPLLYDTIKREKPYISVIVDILRATTTLCTAVYCGAEIIPVATLKEVEEYKKKGYLIAGERLEKGLEMADFGNSAFDFLNKDVRGKEIVHSSTNGTKAMMQALKHNAKEVVVACFSNIDTVADYLIKQKCDVEIVCSGWRGNFCLEDTMFAGALAKRLLEGSFITRDDATNMALSLWKESEKDIWLTLNKAKHVHKLRRHHLDDVFDYTFTFNTCPIVPKLFLIDNIWKILPV
ncbi:MAG: 2-phosphosulfolactate phosphatase [Bacteroidota bacterium]|nr:2-phosphosulfolactate phosphatase [Bacteroidota bacterium]